jgi:hypothetical protein
MRLLITYAVLIVPLVSFGQKIKPEKIARLHLRESSGLAPADSSHLLTLEDGGNKPVIWLISVDGKEVPIALPLTNNDWEDLAEDSSNWYIGDFGNNKNLRQNLSVYILRKPGFNGPFSQITFHYPDQKQFPPSPSNWNFDCEAFFHYRDSLYLFSKNLSHPNDGYTKIYQVPDQPGNYVARLVDSFFLNEPVTSADISEDGKTMVLLTYFSLWVFRDFPSNHFFEGKIFQFPFKGLTQKEAICFGSNHVLFMTDEHHYGKGGRLYKINFDQLDFSKSLRYKKQILKRAIYNTFNHPEKKYKKIMKRGAVQ